MAVIQRFLVNGRALGMAVRLTLAAGAVVFVASGCELLEQQVGLPEQPPAGPTTTVVNADPQDCETLTSGPGEGIDDLGEFQEDVSQRIADGTSAVYLVLEDGGIERCSGEANAVFEDAWVRGGYGGAAPYGNNLTHIVVSNEIAEKFSAVSQSGLYFSYAEAGPLTGTVDTKGYIVLEAVDEQIADNAALHLFHYDSVLAHELGGHTLQQRDGFQELCDDEKGELCLVDGPLFDYLSQQGVEPNSGGQMPPIVEAGYDPVAAAELCESEGLPSPYSSVSFAEAQAEAVVAAITLDSPEVFDIPLPVEVEQIIAERTLGTWVSESDSCDPQRSISGERNEG